MRCSCFVLSQLLHADVVLPPFLKNIAHTTNTLSPSGFSATRRVCTHAQHSDSFVDRVRGTYRAPPVPSSVAVIPCHLGEENLVTPLRSTHNLVPRLYFHVEHPAYVDLPSHCCFDGFLSPP
jgi:hypothetical protein